MPAGVDTVTFTVPVPAGLLAVIVVALTTVTFVAGTVPKSTAEALVKSVPVIVSKVSVPVAVIKPALVAGAFHSALVPASLNDWPDAMFPYR